MARAAILVFLFLFPSLLHAQDTLVGHWEGTVTLPGRAIPIQVDFDHLHSGWQCTILLPETSAPVYTAKSVSVESARVRINLDMGLSSASLDGQLSGDTIEGTYTQGGDKGTFKVKRAASAAPAGGEASKRPNSAPQPGRDESPTAGPAKTPGGGEGSRTSGPQVQSVAATSRVIRNDDGESRGVVPSATADSEDSADGMPNFYAVMFATDEYVSKDWPHLNNPVLDAKNIARELEAYYGFHTKVYENQTAAGIMQIFVDDLRKEKSWKFKPNDELLIFFSGHGDYDELNDRGYVISRDAAPPPGPSEYSLRERQIDFDQIKTWIGKINVDHIMLVLDICQGGRVFIDDTKRGREQSPTVADKANALQRLRGLKTRKCMTSGGKGAVTDGPPGHGSPFARAFMDALAEAGGSKDEMVVSIEEIDTKIEKTMENKEGASQPQFGSCGGESSNSKFYFFWKDPPQTHQ
jgi:hypothetical protein